MSGIKDTGELQGTEELISNFVAQTAKILVPVVLLVYVYMALTLQIIARKTLTSHGWFAWFPILNLFLMCAIARKSLGWVVLLFVPFINIIILVMLWVGIAQTRNKPAWLGILILVPIGNIILSGYLAFSSSKKEPTLQTSSAQPVAAPPKDWPPVYRP